ncbi:PKD domain-containing protein [Haloarchaeobius sp. FL176]|uniref:PKD domain-containing protein n=1 Tax=Haloarchaeobius sp. FL176 TaxID=2967129 RepID=UPI002148DAAC
MLLLTQAVLPGAVAAANDGPTPSLSAPNEAPLTEAGLDQRVPRGRTVLLDGRGSRDPDGTVTDFEWTITHPDGSELVPDCSTCPRTTFEPNETGTYEVRLTVTDDDGASTSDSMFVEVTTGTGPTVSLSGPPTTTTGAGAEFVADAQAGSTELDRIEWRVDGTVVATSDLDGAAENATLEGTFPSPGAYTVSARVFDASNRSDSDTRPVSVTGVSAPGNGTTPNGTTPNGSLPVLPGPGNPGGPSNPSGPGNPSEPSNPGGPGAPGGPENGTGDATTLADQYEPAVRGPQVVTGSQPLRASYRIDDAPPATALQRVVWFRGDGRFDAGDSTSLDWAPGDHRLFAIVDYTDGSSDVVTFPNDRTRVVADPQPSLALSDLAAAGSISGTFTAGDDYGNLVDVVVEVDGRTVYERHASRAGSRPTLGSRVESEFERTGIEPNSTHEVVVRATDGRGQTVTLRREVTSSNEIEVVRAGFVNTPVDSYHERLDPERYTAHHVVEVRLNGNNPESIQSEYDFSPGTDRLHPDVQTREIIQRDNGNVLLIHSYWSAASPDEYRVSYDIQSSQTGLIQGDSEFTVERSDPILVVTTRTAGTEPQTKNWGFVVDASRSFDPDHTILDYYWTGSVELAGESPKVGKFRSRELGGLEVEDQNGGFSARRCCFLQFFTPQIESVKQLDEGPFNATETVRFEVQSDDWAFAKTLDSYGVGLSYGSNSRYISVVEDERVSQGYDTGASGSEQRQEFQRAIIEVQAAALSEETLQPTVSLYNEENPGRIRDNVTLPTVEVNNQTTTQQFRENVSVETLVYRVTRENGTLQATVSNLEELQVYLRNGYETVEQNDRTTGVMLEQKTEREVTQTERISFGSRQDRAAYLRNNSNTHAAGSRAQAVVKQQTEYVWRDSQSGSGVLTGETRQHTIPAQTRTLREYQTQVHRTRTVTEMVRKPFQRTVERTVERTRTRCNHIVGCYEGTVTETVTETVTQYREVTRTREVTWWDRSTYWSTHPHSGSDIPTGHTKEVVVQGPQQIQQYQFAIETQERTTRERFFAIRSQSETVVEWQAYRNTENLVIARRLARQDEIRVGEVNKIQSWVVAKHGETTEVVSEYEERSNVIETIAIVTGEVKERKFNPVTGDTEVMTVRTFREEVRHEGPVDTQYIIEYMRGQKTNCSKGETCEN